VSVDALPRITDVGFALSTSVGLHVGHGVSVAREGAATKNDPITVSTSARSTA
jgi:hypothetical protein